MEMSVKNFYQLQSEIIYQIRSNNITDINQTDISILLNLLKYVYTEMQLQQDKPIIAGRRLLKMSNLYQYLFNIQTLYDSDEISKMSNFAVADLIDNINTNIDQFMSDNSDDTTIDNDINDNSNLQYREDNDISQLNELQSLCDQTQTPYFNLNTIYMISNLVDILPLIVGDTNYNIQSLHILIDKIKLCDKKQFSPLLVYNDTITDIIDKLDVLARSYQIVYNRNDKSSRMIKLCDYTLYGIITKDNAIIDYHDLFDLEYWDNLTLSKFDFKNEYQFHIFIGFNFPVELMDINYNILYISIYCIFEDNFVKILIQNELNRNNVGFTKYVSQIDDTQQMLESIDRYLTFFKNKNGGKR